MGATPFANRRLTAGLAVSCVAIYLLSGSCSWRLRRGPSIFATRMQEQEADKMYHRQQKHEYRVLDSALPPHQWQEATAVQFDASIDLNTTTHRPRLVWDIFGPYYNCPSKEIIGTPSMDYDGGKWMCAVDNLLQGRKCVVYSFGSYGQVEFEEALIMATKSSCEVHVFDFTLTPELAGKVEAIPGVTFHDFGIGSDDVVVKTSYVGGAQTVSEYQLKSLPTIMKELGHDWVDVFKMDVEGAEYEVLPSIVEHYSSRDLAVPVTQAQIEYHHWTNRPSAQDLLETLRAMEKHGFRAFHTEFNYNGAAWSFIEYAYLHVNGDGTLVVKQNGQGNHVPSLGHKSHQ